MNDVGQNRGVDTEMNETPAAVPEKTGLTHATRRMTLIWRGLLLAWVVGLCFVPDPRPLGAPELAVKGIRLLASVSEPIARACATIALRAMGLAGIGILLVQCFGCARRKPVVPTALVLAPLLAVLTLWVNYTFFPIAPQAWFAVLSAILGVLLGLALQRSGMALAAFVILVVGLLAWGTSTGISDDLYDARATQGESWRTAT
jgi:hypothetical protein